MHGNLHGVSPHQKVSVEHRVNHGNSHCSANGATAACTAKDQPFHVLVVRKPVSEILLRFERRRKWVLEASQLHRISLVFIHICKNVFQASCTVISNLYCSLLAVLTTYIANILLQLSKSVNNSKKQEFRTCMYCFLY